MELEVLKLRKAPTAYTTLSKDANDGADPVKSRSTGRKRTIDWPHKFWPGAPINKFERLELTDFVAGFLSMIKTYDCLHKEVILLRLKLLMIKQRVTRRKAFAVFTLTLPDKSSCFAWNSATGHDS